MKTNEIKEALLKHYYVKGKKIATTNFAGCGFSEADVLMIANEFVWEYEVKASRADFKADFKKEHKHKLLSDEKYREENFAYYDQGWMCCPNYFNYVCVEHLIKPEEVPAYAGLVYVSPNGDCKVIKKCKRIHKRVVTQRLKDSFLQNLSAKLIFGCSYMNHLKKEKNIL